ncbi:ORF1064 [White spot syndrome virus]|uniref:ORF1064 n=1 Tax=White spot syndrome virus TaxID=342409 RepID=A0A2D3I6Y0_9VIRU|nr:ORF1064 [White spot syndrome virus]
MNNFSKSLRNKKNLSEMYTRNLPMRPSDTTAALVSSSRYPLQNSTCCAGQTKVVPLKLQQKMV